MAFYLENRRHEDRQAGEEEDTQAGDSLLSAKQTQQEKTLQKI